MTIAPSSSIFCNKSLSDISLIFANILYANSNDVGFLLNKLIHPILIISVNIFLILLLLSSNSNLYNNKSKNCKLNPFNFALPSELLFIFSSAEYVTLSCISNN